VRFNEAACDEAKKYHGYFALVSNCEKEPFECLYKYRKRELIESFFESMKQHADGARLRVWDADTLRGRLFVQFVSLCYYEYLSEEIRKLKNSLAKPNGDPEHDSKKSLELEKKLKAWLGNTPIYLMLQWFDTVESVKVSNKLQSMRWNTEVTARDRMLLDKLGLTLPQ
jgi:transposase